MVYDFNNFPQGAIYKKPLRCRLFGHKWYYGYDWAYPHTLARYCSRCHLVEYREVK